MEWHNLKSTLKCFFNDCDLETGRKRLRKMKILQRNRYNYNCCDCGVRINGLTLFIVIAAFLTKHVDTFEKDFAPPETLTDSVRVMVNDGFSQEEIVNTIKAELGLKRAKTLIGKLYDGDDLTEEEITRMKSGEVDDSDEELTRILHELGMEMSVETNDTVVDRNHSIVDVLWMDKDTDEVVLLKEKCDKEEPDNKKESGNKRASIVDESQQLKPDYAFSPYDLFGLVQTEEAIYKPLKRYIKKMEAKLKILKSYTQDYEDSSAVVTNSLGMKASVEQKGMAIASNPLASYKMIRRFAFKLPDVWNAAAEDLEEELWQALSQIRMKYQPPNEQDWKESVESLLRIQYYNGYKTKEFSQGTLGRISSNVKLTAEDCLEIGLRALNLKQFDFALEWLNLARTKKLKNEDDSEVDQEFLERSLEYAIKQHNQAWDTEPSAPVKSHVFSKKFINPVYIEMAEKKSTLMREASKEFRENEEYDYPIPYNFVSLCSGENLQTNEEKSQLSCWLERSKNPYFYINPVKIELLSTDPYLIQVYEVIGDKLIDAVKQEAISKLQRSQVVNYNDPNADAVSLVRTSSQTWIPHNNLEQIGLLNLPKLIEKITGMSTIKFGGSEDFQVACYGTSHHYDEHLDAVQDERRTARFGERIATFMLYLSSVEEGGKTAFPVLGVAANAIKGSAVFWYNLKKNGEPDRRTWHGGCPVVHGIKWVMNSWILQYENFHTRPCGLRPEE